MGPDARKELVEPHLDGLGELVVVARNGLRSRMHLSNQIRAGLARVGPVLPVLEHDEGVGDRGRHRIGRNLGSADLGSEEHTSELQSLMRISSAVFCLKTKTHIYI